MKNLKELSRYCNQEYYMILRRLNNMQRWETIPKDKIGNFRIRLSNDTWVSATADNGMCDREWEHVSVIVPGKERCLTWEEMCEVNELFFSDEEITMQIHPAKKNNVNVHEFCLHIWRPKNAIIPTPEFKSISSDEVVKRRINLKTGARAYVVVDDEVSNPEWQRVLVTIRNEKRYPIWEEMCEVKDKIFGGDTAVMQLHHLDGAYDMYEGKPALSMWLPKTKKIPLPAPRLVL